MLYACFCSSDCRRVSGYQQLFSSFGIGIIRVDTILLEQMDSNTDGFIDFEEFVAATLHVHQLVEHDNGKWRSLTKAAFDKFDVDKNGYITPDELRMVQFLVNLFWFCMRAFLFQQ